MGLGPEICQLGTTEKTSTCMLSDWGSQEGVGANQASSELWFLLKGGLGEMSKQACQARQGLLDGNWGGLTLAGIWG